jgi:hypothetical protein
MQAAASKVGSLIVLATRLLCDATYEEVVKFRAIETLDPPKADNVFTTAWVEAIGLYSAFKPNPETGPEHSQGMEWLRWRNENHPEPTDIRLDNDIATGERNHEPEMHSGQLCSKERTKYCRLQNTQREVEFVRMIAVRLGVLEAEECEMLNKMLKRELVAHKQHGKPVWATGTGYIPHARTAPVVSLNFDTNVHFITYGRTMSRNHEVKGRSTA